MLESGAVSLAASIYSCTFIDSLVEKVCHSNPHSILPGLLQDIALNRIK